MARNSICSLCKEKTDLWFGAGGIKIGPCCSKPDAMVLFGLDNQKDLNAWYAKFRPNKKTPKLKMKLTKALEGKKG